MPSRVSTAAKLETFTEVWVPKVVGELNGQYVKVLKCYGEYVWHHHENEDEMFLVLKGSIRIELKDGTIVLNEGEFCIIPRGMEHKPMADELAHVLLFEPASTRNTGNVDHAYTIEATKLEKI
jgi:mannose-6-phosphate isomerase-like protein (cupin superfamily)